MKAASLKQIREELESLSRDELFSICLKIAKFQTSNKELASYILFYENDDTSFVADIKIMLNEKFDIVNPQSIFFAKKSIRNIIKSSNKFAKFANEKITKLEIHFYILEKMYELGINISHSIQLQNIYKNQVKKINVILISLHEDVQYDYTQRLKTLS